MPARLIIDAADLRDAVRPILRASKLSAANELTLTFENHELLITREGVSASIPADGEWTGTASVSATFLPLLAKVTEQVIVVSFDAGRLNVGSISVEARWNEEPRFGIDLTLEPTLLDLLRLPLKHSDEALLAHGLFERVQRAQQEVKKLIERASWSLEAVGDFRNDIEKLVMARIRDI